MQVQVGHDGIITTRIAKEDDAAAMMRAIDCKGTLARLIRSYHPSSSDSAAIKYGNEIMDYLSDIQRSSLLIDKLERQQRIQHPADSDVNAIRHTIQEIFDTLVEDLLSLASLHKEAWSQIIPEPTLEHGDEEDLMLVLQEANDHFTRAVNAYDAMLTIYQHLWRVMKRGELNPDQNQNFTPYEQSQIAHGISLGHWNLYDVYNRWFANAAAPTTIDDVSIQYRNLVQAESWCENSLVLLSGVDREDVKEDHDTDVTQARETMASSEVQFARETMAVTEVQFGILLLDMFVQGYVLDIDGNLHQDPIPITAGQRGDELGEGQTRFLDLTAKKISRGLTLYTELAREHGNANDYIRGMADSRHFMGVTYTYQFRWKDAAEELETSVSLYDQVFNEYHERQLDADSLDVVSNLLQATQALWEAYFYLPGKTKDAEKVFRRHLALRRYHERRVPLDQPLVDEEKDEDTPYYSNRQKYAADGQGELNDYKMKLNEYLQLLSESPPDGSYYDYDIGFEYDGVASSIIKHDKVYEGSLRSAIGALQLVNNQVWEAIAELELSVDLLRDGARESYVAYDENDEVIEYSVEQELANSLLNLAYAQKELKQWKSAAQSFSEAMDIYEPEELPVGGGTIDRSTKDKEGYLVSLGDKLTSFIKGRLGVDGNSTFTLNNYHMMHNTTPPA
ncbi:hypothetical protein ACHAW5_003918 [Stephanodiscus triporus]|uniref:KIF-binding protein n=1 Tax=Stephanodiscus triporus TaxID=2934178 RepID=A0ABD3MSZ9_9STRA